MNKMDNKIGLHLKFDDDFFQACQTAIDLNLNFFQSFLFDYKNHRYINPDKNMLSIFERKWKARFDFFVAHAAYVVNLANGDLDSQFVLKKELYIANKLSFKYFVVHPGTKRPNLIQARQQIAKTLNKINKLYPKLIILLENTAHGGNDFGSNLEDFQGIWDDLDYPEKVGFCFDTAHAYSFGYDLFDSSSISSIIKSIFPAHALMLLHLNDTDALKGSKIDRHAILGSGNIGVDVLKKITADDLFNNLPFIFELPDVSEQQLKIIINNFKK